MPELVSERTVCARTNKYYTIDFDGCMVQVQKVWDEEGYDEDEGDYQVLNYEEVSEELNVDEYEELIRFIEGLS